MLGADANRMIAIPSETRTYKGSEEVRRKRREYYHKMYQLQKEHIQELKRKKYHEDPERFRKYRLKWMEKNPNYIRDYYREYYRTVGHDGGNSKRTKKVIDAHVIASQIPMEQYCELCHPEDRKLAEMRHHMDYDYPTIFVSVCRSCHTAIHKALKKQEAA